MLYETSCVSCRDKEGRDRALYIGESARSPNERFNEHMDDARLKRPGSHIWKHWSTQHQGLETRFKFEVVAHFNTPLERQVSEAVRIERTGATRILNSKAEYSSRSTLPRIRSIDTEVEVTLGDSGELAVDDEAETGEDEVFETEANHEFILTGKNHEKSEARRRRKERMVDLLDWGNEYVGQTDEETDNLLDLVVMFLEKEEVKPEQTKDGGEVVRGWSKQPS